VPHDLRVLDVTRLASRLGRGALTGIDRVELAYARRFLEGNVPALALLRTAAGVVVLRAGALRWIAERAEGAPLPARRDLLARLTRRGSPVQGAVETALRGFALRRAPMALAGVALRRAFAGRRVGYYNVGHSNLSGRMLRALRGVPGLEVVVMIHDTIPLDHPEFARPGTVEPFRARLAAVSAHAHRVIHITADARARTEAQMARLGRVPPGIVAPIGVTPAAPDPAALPPGLPLDRPWFVALGTIEPRKNIGLLLDVWEAMAAAGRAPPRLFILGGRGWAGADLLARLDALPPDGPVRVLQGLGDGAVAALLAGAEALLFPSMAEGFGLPPLEAAALGTPVIAGDLAVTKELLGDYAVYLPLEDRYPWQHKIEERTENPGRLRGQGMGRALPAWEDHFNRVLSLE